jgi:hypothetical protein
MLFPDPGTSRALVATSRQLIAGSRALMARSRRLAAASRTLTRPLCGGADGSNNPVTPIGLRASIRQLLEDGHLPPLFDSRSWLGQGHGDVCLLCSQAITLAHWEREVEAPPLGEVRTHAVCFRMWVEESDRLLKKTA